ncbi:MULTISPECIES: DUF3592 domain-containing protein [unclassified Streptomyces]|uniref:DUF3592 domain-containing protein n=1 Tax=unclassified Streptomyces TaxID=2593676 RepID=UPI0011E839BA|nr:DUF3592 domain-containing protein [Streptomyces sp. sk2.1]TXS77998.1 DUF3592 domain-containing protein [Streptomyces sp. sk2.1]
MWIAMSLVAGVTLLGFGVHEAMIRRRLRRGGIGVSGLVVSHRRSSSGRGDAVHFAVVEFVDERGGRHTFESGSSGVGGLPVGGRVPVRYVSDAPEHARIDLTGRRIGDVALPFMGGGLFTAVGIWILVTGR